ncbi:MAG: peptidoglycan-binding protein [Clostridia bacterium]|nr:peptidoglycan-binding protein [Clostridia bacterium]
MANEKVISTQALIDKFKEALADKWGYIWGTAGEKWTAAKQAQLDKTTDADRANSRKYGSQWIGHMVADCSGLFSWAFKQLGGYMYHGSDTMFRKYCTETGELKTGKRTDGQGLKPGTAVFVYKSDKKKYTHVGLYIGDGWVIEAAGARQGVIRGKITNSKWTNWGELKGVDYSGTSPEPTPDPQPEPVKRPTIRKGNKNTYVKEMQQMLQKLGYSLGICGVDGDFGTATEKAVKEFQRDNGLTQDGICGPKTWTALQEAVDKLQPKPVPVKTYSVIIRGLDLTQAQAIANNYPGAEIKEE